MKTEVDLIQKLENKITKRREICSKDRHYYQIDLNLSGQRIRLETETVFMITKYGYLKALKKSRIGGISNATPNKH